VPRQSPLDLVKSIAALAKHISRVQNGAHGSAFVFRADAGEKNQRARPGNGNDFRESRLGPFAVL